MSRASRDNRGKAALCLVTALSTTLAMTPGVALAQAAQDTATTVALTVAAEVEGTPAATSGIFGTCSWDIDSDGTLTIAPAEGETGELAACWDEENGIVVPWMGNESVKRVVVKEGVVANASSPDLFSKLTSCTSMDLSGLDTSNVTNMASMFYGCKSLRFLDLSSFDTSKVTDMGWMFSCDVSDGSMMNLRSVAFGEGWNTSNVVNFSCLFQGCNAMEYINMCDFDTSAATDMGNMFFGCDNLKTINLGWDFDTSNVTDMSAMFGGCHSLETIDNFFLLRTPKVENMSGVFYECTSLEELDLSCWDTPNVTDMSYMFAGSDQYAVTARSIEFGDGWDTSKVTDMSRMFYKCICLEELDLSMFDTSNVTNMTSMFEKCWSLENILIGSGWDTSKVTESADMFKYAMCLPNYTHEAWDVTRAFAGTKDEIAGYLSDVPTSGEFGTCSWDIDRDGTLTIAPTWGKTGELAASESEADEGSVPWTGNESVKRVVVKKGVVANEASCGLFSHLPNCTVMDLSGLDTSKVENMQSFFYGCYALKTIDLSGFDTSNVTNMRHLFYGCHALKFLDLSSFDTSKVTDMGWMFSRCYSEGGSMALRGIEFGEKWDTSNVTSLRAIFQGCTALESIDLRAFDTSKVEKMRYMFSDCTSLNVIRGLNSLDTSKATDMECMFFGCTSLESIDLSGFDTSNVTNMEAMFCDCASLKSLDLSSFDTSNVENMSYMFAAEDEDAMPIESIEFGDKWSTSKVTDMSYMFCGCTNLQNLHLESFDTSNVTDMTSMFENCSSLEEVLAGDGWDTSKVTESEDMFKGAALLPGFDANVVDATRAYAGPKDGCPGYLDVAADYLGGTSGIDWSLGDGKWKSTSYWTSYAGTVNCKVRVSSCKVTTKANGSHVVTVKWAAKQSLAPTSKQVHKYAKAEQTPTPLAVCAYDYTTGLSATGSFGATVKDGNVKYTYGKAVKDSDGCKWKPWKTMSLTVTFTLPASYKGSLCICTGGLSKKAISNIASIQKKPFGSTVLSTGAKWYFNNGINFGSL